MTPHVVLTILGAAVIGSTAGVLLMRAAPAAAQARSCEHEGREYRPGDRACIEGHVHVCSAATGRWLATEVKCSR